MGRLLGAQPPHGPPRSCGKAYTCVSLYWMFVCPLPPAFAAPPPPQSPAILLSRPSRNGTATVNNVSPGTFTVSMSHAGSQYSTCVHGCVGEQRHGIGLTVQFTHCML